MPAFSPIAFPPCRILCLSLSLAASLAGTLFPATASATEAPAPATAATPATEAATDFVTPPPSLKLEGIPPIPKQVADRVALYTEFRPRGLAAWHPVKREMLVSARLGNATQIYRLAQPNGQLELLTDFPDPVTTASFQPRKGEFFLFTKDRGGNEQLQIHRYDIATRQVTQLTPDDFKHALHGWSHRGDRVLYTASALDKNGKKAEATTELWVMDPLSPTKARRVATLPGGGWRDFKWSIDDKHALAIEFKSANESAVWEINLATGERTRLLPREEKTEAPVAYRHARYGRDGKSLLVTTDRDGEFLQLAYVDRDSGKHEYFADKLGWDVVETKPSPDGKLLAVIVNEAGRGSLRLFDIATRKPLPVPPLPTGSITSIKWRKGSAELGFEVESARSPGDIHVLNLATKTVERWTETRVPGIDTASFREPELVRWKSFDDREITGYLYRPPARFTGPRPVQVSIHGGPEGQARGGFIRQLNYVVNEMGIAIVFPNVRGSSGFGKTFLALDNGFRREDSVKDIGALFDWIATQPDLDAKRILVSGGSYGGYMSLAVATHYSDRIVGTIDSVGISNFLTFLDRTETYRRDLRRVEYGDERDVKMREFLQKISPVNNAANIKKPLFVIQGKNDPRVPVSEAEQIVAKVRELKVPVWYLLAEDEGHGFKKKSNADFQFYATVRFLEEHLLK